MFRVVSESNYEILMPYLQSNKYFAVKKDSFTLIKEEMLPALDKNGRILMESPYKVKLIPSDSIFESLLKIRV